MAVDLRGFLAQGKEAGSADTELRQKDRKGTAIFRREAVYNVMAV